jgi:Adenylate and Guanylate cyclase catalytic domain
MWHKHRICYSTIVGYISTNERDEFTAIGTHVNLASRLESRATGNQIIVSSHTKEFRMNLVQKQFKPGEKIKASANLLIILLVLVTVIYLLYLHSCIYLLFICYM